MDSIEVAVLLVGETQKAKEIFEKVESVASVKVNIYCEEPSRITSYIDQNHDTYVMTSALADVEEFRNHPELHVVFWGSAETLEDHLQGIPDNLIDIWPGQEEDAVRSFRFHKLCVDIKNDFEQWLYHNWLMATIDSMQDMVWYKDAAGLHWLVNHKFEDTVQKTRAQVHGMGHNYIWDVPPEDAGKSEFRCLESEREVMEKKETCVADEHVKTANGMLRHFITYKSPLYARDGKEIIGTVGIGHDITDLNNVSLEIKMLLENLPFAIMVCDLDWKPVQVNSEFVRRFQIDHDQFEGFDYRKWKSQNFVEKTERRYQSLKHNYSQELARTVDQKEQVYSLVEQEILDYFGDISGYYCMYQDVTLQREYQQMILNYANTDSLTGMYNRRYFFEYIEKHMELPMTVFYMDMDNFKKINDTLGHSTGDSVLIAVGKKVEEEFLVGLAARLGGDEFAAVILGDLDWEVAERYAEEMEKWTEETYAPMQLGISISVGIAQTIGGESDIDAFIEESDQMMYQHKNEKRAAKQDGI